MSGDNVNFCTMSDYANIWYANWLLKDEQNDSIVFKISQSRDMKTHINKKIVIL